jgi:hypothetical protein
MLMGVENATEMSKSRHRLSAPARERVFGALRRNSSGLFPQWCLKLSQKWEGLLNPSSTLIRLICQPARRSLTASRKRRPSSSRCGQRPKRCRQKRSSSRGEQFTRAARRQARYLAFRAREDQPATPFR